jgi:hypothetical protein
MFPEKANLRSTVFELDPCRRLMPYLAASFVLHYFREDV